MRALCGRYGDRKEKRPRGTTVGGRRGVDDADEEWRGDTIDDAALDALVKVKPETWEGFDDKALDAEIAKFRASAEALRAEIVSRGAAVGGTDAFEYEDVRAASGTNGETNAEDDEELGNIDDIDPREWMVPPVHSVHANVTTYDWKPMYEHEQFDVIMMDPALAVGDGESDAWGEFGVLQLTDQHIAGFAIAAAAKERFTLRWVINAKYQWCLNQFKKWGYELVDEIVWVKVTNSRRLAKSHGFYLQHAKEVCLSQIAAIATGNEG